jgi:hypothetical protein
VSNTISVGHQQQQVYNAVIPKEGPKSVAFNLDFTASAAYVLDFTLAYQQTVMTVVQSCWIDNSGNADILTISVDNTGQIIQVPPNAQGTFPIIAAIRPKISVKSAGNVVVPTMWLNVPIPLAVWYPAGQGGGGTISGTVDIGNVVTITGTVDVLGTVEIGNTVTVEPASGAPAAGSAHSITTGGTPVAVFAPNSILNNGFVINPLAATESLFVDAVNAPGTVAPGANGTTIELAAGDAFTFGPNTGTVMANAATSAHTFTAFRM